MYMIIIFDIIILLSTFILITMINIQFPISSKNINALTIIILTVICFILNSGSLWFPIVYVITTIIYLTIYYKKYTKK